MLLFGSKEFHQDLQTQTHNEKYELPIDMQPN